MNSVCCRLCQCDQSKQIKPLAKPVAYKDMTPSVWDTTLTTGTAPTPAVCGLQDAASS